VTKEKHYEYALRSITGIHLDYDGYSVKSAAQMRALCRVLPKARKLWERI